MILSKTWAQKSRGSFERRLDFTIYGLMAVEMADKDHKTSKAAPLYWLKEIEKRSKPGHDSYTPTDLSPLGGFEGILDPRIMFGQRNNAYGWTPGVEPFTNRDGKPGTARAVCSIYPPAYSGTGKFSCLTIYADLSFSTAHLDFYLERSKTGWKLNQVFTQFPDDGIGNMPH